MLRAWTAAVLIAATAVAHADPGPMLGGAFGRNAQLVLDEHEVAAAVTAEINLDKGELAQPLSLAPDVWFGVTQRWTLGVIHSDPSVDRIAAGATVCARSCDHYYRGSGLDARWGWRPGPLAIAPRIRLLVRDVDPIKPAVTLGALARWARGRYAITGDPYLRLGLANQDRGNRAGLVIPVWLSRELGPCWLIAVHTGWDSDLAVWRDGWHVPFGLAARVVIDPHVALGIEAGFSSLLGPQNNIKQRAVLITADWRR